MRALSELQLINDHSIAVPNSMINYTPIFNKRFDSLNW